MDDSAGKCPSKLGSVEVGVGSAAVARNNMGFPPLWDNVLAAFMSFGPWKCF